MRRKSCTFLFILLIISSDLALGKNGNNTKNHRINKNHNNVKDKADSDRVKRSLDEEDRHSLWPSGGKISYGNPPYDNYLKTIESDSVVYGKVHKEPPFWATRGRRDSSSENDGHVEYTENNHNDHNLRNNLFCKGCVSTSHMSYVNPKDIKDELFISPFWGNRGRRDSSEMNENVSSKPFWGNRGRREENEPFWGNRGRRSKALQFWGSRGKQEEEPFWGNRGRRQDNPFWGNRGKREDEPFWGNRGRRDDAPFWGNRGRREDSDPFWSNRGRRQESEPFWGNRGRREESEPFWGNRGRRRDSKFYDENRSKEKEDLKEVILSDLNGVEYDVENLARLRRSGNIGTNSFWANRGRNSQLKYLFNGSPRSRLSFFPPTENIALSGPKKISEAQTVLDSRIYAEEPHYIIVERSSRSSAEDDPYFISRGKKYYINYGLIKAARDRRGAIEEIVKSVRNDPYYIARGKKDTDIIRNTNSSQEELEKIKNLVCAALNILMVKNEIPKVKREINENDRDRRTILKKLAAQLQMDPYFVSRGKKYEESDRPGDNLNEFISDMARKCN